MSREVRSPRELAAELAERARGLRRRALTELREPGGSSRLRRIQAAIRGTPAADRSEEAIADAFAQTVTCGLITARLLGAPSPATGERFTRTAALRSMPSTDPLLNELFRSGLDPEEGESPLLRIVDDVADLLGRLDVDRVFGHGHGHAGARRGRAIHFYEQFLSEYDESARSRRGVYATPAPLVTYVVESVDELLRRELGLEDGLASTETWGQVARRIPGVALPEGAWGAGRVRATRSPIVGKGLSPSEPFVRILDPGTGTGTFLCACVRRIERTMKERWRLEIGARDGAEGEIAARWNEYVPRHLLPRLCGHELMMAPWAVAHLLLHHEIGQTGYLWTEGDRLPVFLKDALEPAALAGRFTVVLGNPPYAGSSSNMTPHAKELVAAYKVVDGEPLNERKLWLQDDYVKFFGLAQRLLDASGAGVLGYVANHGFVDNPTFRGMRQSLLGSFTSIHVLDMHGNAHKREAPPGGEDDENVFDIRQGVALFLAARRPGSPPAVRHADLWGSRAKKALWLHERSLASTPWEPVTPSSPHYFFEPERSLHRAEYEQGYPLTEIFVVKSAGFITARDRFVMDIDRQALLARIEDFADPALSDAEIRARYLAGTGSDLYPEGDTRGFKLPAARRRVQADRERRERVQRCLVRPFDERYVYWAEGMVDWPRPELARHMDLEGNLALITTRITKDAFGAFVTRLRPGHKSVGAYDVSYAFPLYRCSPPDRGGGESAANNRAPNLAPEFLEALARARKGGVLGPSPAEAPTAEQVLCYVYAILHSAAYRERYAELLAIDFPRIPLPAGEGLFERLAALGEGLVDAHLMERRSARDPGRSGSGASVPAGSIVGRASHSRETVWIDEKRAIGFEGVPEEVYRFRIGGHRVCERWLSDRRGRALSAEDVERYGGILSAVAETRRIMRAIDELIEQAGGFPSAFVLA